MAARIKAHGNLSKGLMSVSVDGAPIQHVESVEVRMIGCKFKVAPGAHRRIVDVTGHREISAKIWGDDFTMKPITSVDVDPAEWVEVTYNPIAGQGGFPERDYFYTRDGVRVDRASVVRFITHPSMSNVTKCRAYVPAEEV
tara:strand:- start:491 stop:913 length:423 start_codon:yes stop_codon:yes gene_type:complete